MKQEFAIKKFKEQIDSINQIEFKLWLDTTYTYVEDFFKSFSNQAINFHSLISEVDLYYIGLPNLRDINKEIRFKERAIGYLMSYITYISELQKEKSTMDDKIQKDINDGTKKSSITKKQSIISEPIKKPMNEKSSITINISKELFWIISSSIVAATFFLGSYIGQVKFDKEKIEYYEQNKALKGELNIYKTRTDSLMTKNQELTLKNVELEKNYNSALANFGDIYAKYEALSKQK